MHAGPAAWMPLPEDIIAALPVFFIHANKVTVPVRPFASAR